MSIGSLGTRRFWRAYCRSSRRAYSLFCCRLFWVQRHPERKWGPVALAGGVSLSFITIGLFVATIGFGFGIDAGLFRVIAAFVMMLFGAIRSCPRFRSASRLLVDR